MTTARELAAPIAAELTKLTDRTWTVIPADNRDVDKGLRAEIIDTYGRKIMLGTGWWGRPNRLVTYGMFSGEYNQGGQYEPVEITSALTKTPKQLAADIARRFLPRFEPAFDEVAQRVAASNADREQLAETVEMLVEAFGEGSHARADKDQATIFPVGDHTYKVEAYKPGAAWRVELHGLSPQTVIEVVELVRARGRAERLARQEAA